MDRTKLRDLQLIQLKIMDEIHRICIKYDLKYYMIGGTALGAIRHKGFIPWDVDIDIAMPRNDYEKFIYLASIDLNNQFECKTYKNTKEFYSPHILVVLKNSKISFKNDNLNPHICRFGIYVDILPLDQVSNDKNERLKHAILLSIIEKIKYYKLSPIYSVNSNITRIIKRLIRLLLSPLSFALLNDIQQRIATKYNYEENTGIICSTLSHYKYEKLCMPQNYFGTPQLYPFEDRMYYGPMKINEYLSQIFGNYMQIPSINIQEEQIQMIESALWEFN